MALPYFLSARAYIYEHLISRALTSFFSPLFPAAPPARPPAQLDSVSAGGRPDPGCSGCSASPEPMEISKDEILTPAGSREGRGSPGKSQGGKGGADVIHQQ